MEVESGQKKTLVAWKDEWWKFAVNEYFVDLPVVGELRKGMLGESPQELVVE